MNIHIHRAQKRKVGGMVDRHKTFPLPLSRQFWWLQACHFTNVSNNAMPDSDNFLAMMTQDNNRKIKTKGLTCWSRVGSRRRPRHKNLSKETQHHRKHLMPHYHPIITIIAVRHINGYVCMYVCICLLAGE